jgi:putative transposase
MAKPSRNSNRSDIVAESRTFFVTSKTAQGRCILQSERMATLFIDVLRSYTLQSRFRVLEFVVMPDHVHVLVTINGMTSIEKAVQLMKGGFSFRAKRELGFQGEVWQRGFSEVRVLDRASFLRHREYIDDNPVRAGLADSAENYPYCSAYLRKQKRSG